ncbi:hypothetical protein AXW67_06320 [Bradyrhizobium neotropicale]|uniref:Uncharacterized protein n=1 Tax=Bradyrhizobium neotropicale TaxID=1497615 RepID=A0A176ZD41_9BRAD|nr:hypothetical protein AXW67_06320 [Bradyrhizobium neotropicale]
MRRISDSEADFFGKRLSVNHMGYSQSDASGGSISGSNVMTFVGRLSVVTAYLAMAFVAAIVLGMI